MVFIREGFEFADNRGEEFVVDILQGSVRRNMAVLVAFVEYLASFASIDPSRSVCLRLVVEQDELRLCEMFLSVEYRVV